MERLLLSIIIPTLNEEEYLPRLLQDLSVQKDVEFEVLVIDGGSTDATINRAKSYIPKLNLQIINSDKANVSYQRNLGAKKAQGEYAVFFDADVQITPLFINKLREGIRLKHAAFYTTWVRPDSKNSYDTTIAKFINWGMELSVIIERPFVTGFEMIIDRRIFLRLGGFREDLKHAEDVDLSLRLQKAGYKLVVLRRPILTFSLRRYRHEGRLAVLRKNAKAGLHILTKGPITQDIFSYPMGGGWYKTVKKENNYKAMFQGAEKYVKRVLKLLWE